MVEGGGGRRRRRSLLSFQLALLFLCFSLASPRALSDSDLLDETAGNSSSDASLNASSLVKPKEGSFADIIDRALEKEFNESDQIEGTLSLSLSISEN